MNEMKQRVSDEQALSDKTCGLYCPDCDLAMGKPEDWKCPHGETHVSKYAADLLDSRAIIEKQSLLIKGMSRFIDRIGIYQLDAIDETDRRFFLDRTKALEEIERYTEDCNTVLYITQTALKEIHG